MKNKMITYEIMKKALDNLFGTKNIDTESIAIYVMNFFGYYDSVIDNVLRFDDRDIFYMLEEEGILTTDREEVTLLKGKLWRVHYWVLNKDKIIKLANMEENQYEEPDETVDYEKIYEQIDWERKSMPHYSGT